MTLRTIPRAAAALAVVAALAAAPLPAKPPSAGLLDTLYFGDPDDERAHRFASDNSQVRPGGLGQACRAILPAKPPADSGGSVTFTLRCDPTRQNYLTARLWGGDVGETVLHLVLDGKQLGCNHSDWPPLDKLNWREMEPRFPGRFFYSTYLLPRQFTRGKTHVTLGIRALGKMYSYARTYEQGQHKQTTPSQGLYAVYTHTEALFPPPAGEVQGHGPKLGGPRKPREGLGPYEYNKRQTQARLDDLLRRTLSPPRETLGIALAYNAPWAAQHKDKAVLDRIVKTVDTYVLRDDVKSLGWSGPGELAEAIWRVYDAAARAGCFDRPLGKAGQARKSVYASFFRKAVDYQTEPRNRGGLANQDIYINTSVYRCHLLLKRLDPTRALPEKTALDLVYQAVGLRPYKGRFYPGKGEQRSTAYRFIIGGPIFLSDKWDYYWVTPKGSSKEHGFVCGYGEMACQTATLYELTRDENVKRQAIRMIASRAPLRVFRNDREGNAAVAIEAAIGWRGNWYPGRVEYADQYLKAAAVLGDPVSVRLAQLYLAHGMIYRKPRRPQLPLMVQRVEYVKQVLAAKPSTFRFPMRDDQPDFAWADEQLRTLAFKHHGRRCWMTMGWRAAGINNIARVHYTEPAVDRIANIRVATEFTPRGRSITRPKEQCGPFIKPGTSLATDGQVLPLAAGPLGGMGDFYTARYGEYLIGMNCTRDKTFPLAVPPARAGEALTDLLSGKALPATRAHTVGPGRTMILHLPGRR